MSRGIRGATIVPNGPRRATWARLRAAHVLSAAVLLAGPAARAGSVAWATDNSGDWLDPVNWSSNPALPGPGDDVTIDRLPANPTVTLAGLNQQAAVNSLALFNPLHIQGASLAIGTTLTLDSVLTLEGGTISGATINAGPGGQIIVPSPSSSGFFNSTLDGVTLNAPLTLNASSTLNLTGAWRNNGTITVLGNGQLWLKGNVTTDAFATIHAPAEGVLLGGTFDNSGRTLALTASTGSWLLGAPNGGPPLGTIIGGTITTSGGAQLIGSAGTLDGVTLSGSLLVRGSTLTISHDLTLDHATITTAGPFPTLKFDGNGPQTLSGTGTIILSSNSTFTIPNVPAGVSIGGIGNLFGSTGTLLNQGTISTSNSLAPLDIGVLLNQGTLNVSNGGTLSVRQLANFSNGTLTGGTFASFGNRSSLVLNGANVGTNAANLVLDGIGSGIYSDANGTNALAPLIATSGGGSFTVEGGRSFAPTAGAYSNSGLLHVGAASTFTAPVQLTNTGTVTGAGGVSAHLNNAGVVAPGDAGPGVLTANGVFTQSAGGMLNLRIGGPAAGTQYDQLNVNGGLALAGTLNVSLLNGFTPGVGETFQVLRFQADSGGFDALHLPALPAGSAWDTSRLYSDGILAVAAAPASGTPNPNPLPAAFPRPPVATTGIVYGADRTAGGFDTYWANPMAGDFAYFNNWADQIAPSPADTAVFNIGSTGHTVHFTADTQTHGLSVGDDHVTFDLGGHQYTVDNGTVFQYSTTVGLSPAASSLEITHGTFAPRNFASVGFASGSNATLLVDGADAHVAADTLYVGDKGNGEADLATGASVVTSSATLVGEGNGSSGTIRVIGPGSSWNNRGQNTTVAIGGGVHSQGALYVTAGATFQSISGLSAAAAPDSTALVVVSGVSGNARSTLGVSSATIGDYGTATLNIADGGLVSDTGLMDIGSTFGSSGTIMVGSTVAGLTSQLNASHIDVANNASGLPASAYSGLLALNAGGQVSAPSGITLGNGATGTGSLTIAGGQAGIGSLNVVTGSASMSSGLLTVSGGEIVGEGFTNASFGQTGGSHTITGLAVGNDTLRIGDPSRKNGPSTYRLGGGTLVVNGNTANYDSFVQTGGTATLQTVTGTGMLSVGGGAGAAVLSAFSISQAALSVADHGTVTLRPLPTIGTNTVSALNISGSGRLNLTSNRLLIQYPAGQSPAAVVAQYLASGYDGGLWDGPGIDSSSAHGAISLGFADSADGIPNIAANTLLVKLALDGDTNLDGRVDFPDLLNLAEHYGRTATWDSGDFNYDGTAGFDDLLLLAQNYGRLFAATASMQAEASAADAVRGVSPVPEPNLLALVASGMLFAGRRRRRRNAAR